MAAKRKKAPEARAVPTKKATGTGAAGRGSALGRTAARAAGVAGPKAARKAAAPRTSKPAKAPTSRAAAARKAASPPRSAASAKTAGARKAAASPRAATKRPAARKAVGSATAATGRRTRPRVEAPVEPPVNVVPAASDEERIEAAKYLPRDLPRRLFEEERFLFPESYGITRVRLLIKDPEWLFVHWDVASETLDALIGELGERTFALTRLTLRVADAENGGVKTILLPAGVRSWYVRADTGRSRAYNARLGLTLPSGEFRELALSNTVVTPRMGPSAEAAVVRRRLGGARQPTGAKARNRPAAPGGEPWHPRPERTDAARSAGSAGPGGGLETKDQAGAGRGGASDAFSPGGASETHRR
jgi:Domain of unknown function (DUF4912)